jgi:RNA polymerase sigma-70 factor (sigma-E family)
VRAGDEREFREYVSGRQASLYKAALLMTCHPQQAEDLVQVTLAKLAQRWRRVREVEHIDAYVRRAMYHQQVSWWRRRGGREHPTESPPERAAPGDLAEAMALRLTLAQALQRLSARQRSAVVLRYYADLPEAEVARAMNCSVGAVRSHTGRALTKLRALCPELAIAHETEEAPL